MSSGQKSEAALTDHLDATQKTIGLLMPLAEQRGGAELMFMHFLREQAKCTSEQFCLFFFDEGRMAQQARDLGFDVEVSDPGRLRQPIRMARCVAHLCGWLKRKRVTMLVSWMSKAHCYAGPAARLSGIPSIWWQHDIPRASLLNRYIARLPARAVFACSTQAASAQLRLQPRTPTSVIYPCVDLSRAVSVRPEQTQAVRDGLGLSRGETLLVVVARLQRWKGIHHVIDALSLLVNAGHKPRLAVVGGAHGREPDYGVQLTGRIASLGLGDRVVMVGFQSRAEHWIGAADIFVHGAEGEPFGMALVEAMAMGKPVVAVDSGGPAEIVTHDENGLLAARAQADLLAAEIEKLIESPELRTRLAKQAVVRAQAFSPERLRECFHAELMRHLAHEAVA